MPISAQTKRKRRLNPSGLAGAASLCLSLFYSYAFNQFSDNISQRASKAMPLALRAMLRVTQRSRSNFACLADKRACRLGFAALSAPPLTV